MNPKETKYWSSIPFLLIGAFLGLFFLLFLRVEYYRLMDYHANMAPQIAFFFFPIPLLFIVLIAMPFEAIFRRYWYKPATRPQTIMVGAGYATAVTWWAFASHWYLILILNPIMIRWIIGLTTGCSGSAEKSPDSH